LKWFLAAASGYCQQDADNDCRFYFCPRHNFISCLWRLSPATKTFLTVAWLFENLFCGTTKLVVASAT